MTRGLSFHTFRLLNITVVSASVLQHFSFVSCVNLKCFVHRNISGGFSVASYGILMKVKTLR